MSHNEVN